MIANEVMAQLEQATADVSVEQVPALLGELERLKAGLWARLVVPAHNGAPQTAPISDKDKLLTPEEAAELLSVKVSWLYRNWQRLPFARKLSRKALRFNESGLRRWQVTRRA